jgi:hypothetical protein
MAYYKLEEITSEVWGTSLFVVQGWRPTEIAVATVSVSATPIATTGLRFTVRLGLEKSMDMRLVAWTRDKGNE